MPRPFGLQKHEAEFHPSIAVLMYFPLFTKIYLANYIMVLRHSDSPLPNSKYELHN